MLPKLARLDGQFPFLDILEKQPPFRTSDGNIWYEASKNSNIDVEKNTHFALGICWKASVHPWSGTKKDPMIDLGPYTEKIRLFLTGEGPHPEHVSLQIFVARREKPFVGLVTPFQGSTKGCHNFLFFIPGIEFSLYVGKVMPRAARVCSFYANPRIRF